MSAANSWLTHSNVRNIPVLSWILDHKRDLDVVVKRKTILKRDRNDDSKNEEFVEPEYEKVAPKSRKLENPQSKVEGKLPADLGSRIVSAGGVIRSMNMNQRITSVEDSLGIFKRRDADALWKRFSEKGYVLFRGLLDRDKVLSARQNINSLLTEMNFLAEDGRATSKQGWTLDRDSGTVIVGQDEFYKDEHNEKEAVKMWKKMAHLRDLEDILHSTMVEEAINLLATGKSNMDRVHHRARTFDPNYTWLRIKAPREFTAEHADIFYFKGFTGLFSPGISDAKPSRKSSSCSSSTGARTAPTAASSVDPDHSRCFRCSKAFKSKQKQQQDQTPIGCSSSAAAAAGGAGAVSTAAAGAGGAVTGGSTRQTYRKKDREGEEKDRDRCYVRCGECNRSFSFHLYCVPQPDNKSFPPQSAWYCPSCIPRPLLGTCWIPLGDVPVEDGVLAMLPGSAHLPNFDKVFKDSQMPSSYFTHAKGLTWHTGAFQAGDFVLFDCNTIHCTSRNYSNSYRVSMDFRWFLAPDRNETFTTKPIEFMESHTRPL